MNQFSRQFINQDVGAVSVPNTKYMSNDTGHSHASRIVQPHREPSHWLAMFFGKVMSHHWLELLHEFGISFGELGGGVIFDLKFF